MTRPTKDTAYQRAAGAFLAGMPTYKVTGKILQDRINRIKADPRLQDTMVDIEATMVLLGLSYETLLFLKKINPPPHPFSVRKTDQTSSRKAGRPKFEDDQPVKALTAPKRGRPLAVATVEHVLAWFDALIAKGVHDGKPMPSMHLPPDYVVFGHRAPLPFAMKGRTSNNQGHVVALLSNETEVLKAIRNGGELTFMPIREALQLPWSDPAERALWASEYAQVLQEEADAARVAAAELQAQALDADLPPAPPRRRPGI